MKRFSRIALALILLLSLFPVTAYANSPVVPPWYWFELSNLPEGTEYVDLLIELPEDDPQYVTLVAENLPEGFSQNAPIVTYCEDDFRSYTFHYTQAVSIIEIDEDGGVYFFTKDTLQDGITSHEQDIYERGQIRLALLDASGNILKVSRTFSLHPRGLMEYQLNWFRYDAKEDHLDMETTVSSIGMLIFVVLSVLGVMFTCFVEGLIARAFGLWKTNKQLIRRTNLISQIVMRLLHIVLYRWLFYQYFWTVLILELLVYTAEYLVYHKWMMDESDSRILWYTVAANTASLVLSMIPMVIW